MGKKHGIIVIFECISKAQCIKVNSKPINRTLQRSLNAWSSISSYSSWCFGILSPTGYCAHSPQHSAPYSSLLSKQKVSSLASTNCHPSGDSWCWTYMSNLFVSTQINPDRIAKWLLTFLDVPDRKIIPLSIVQCVEVKVKVEIVFKIRDSFDLPQVSWFKSGVEEQSAVLDVSDRYWDRLFSLFLILLIILHQFTVDSNLYMIRMTTLNKKIPGSEQLLISYWWYL
jgi:hypothetical protein